MSQDITSTIGNFLQNIENDSNHRYKSWEHCYKFFTDKRREIREEVNSEGANKKIVDTACLNLAFYLASWGMYRGSSGLLWKDYKVYHPIIAELVDEDYDELVHLGFNESNSEKKTDSINILFNLVEKLKKIIEEIDYYKSGGSSEKVSATDTLLTKIIMGTLGSTPAYDLYFKDGCKEEGISPYSNFNKNSFGQLVDFYVSNKEDFNEAADIISNSSIEYPPMKLVDMYRWQLGNEAEN